MSPFEIPKQHAHVESHGEQSEFTPQNARAEERGVLMKLLEKGGGKMKRTAAGIMLGSALIFGGGALMNANGQGRIESGVTQTEGFRDGESAESFVKNLTKSAMKEVVRSGTSFTKEGTREVKQPAGPEYAKNKRAAIDMTNAYLAVQKDKAGAARALAEELNNPALEQGTKDGINQVILRFLRSAQ